MPLQSDAILRFYRLIAEARLPQRADRSAAGTLPTRAYRYCEAVRNATAYGWWIFPPIDLTLLWDGGDIFWHCDGLADWLPLTPSAQFPAFATRFDDTAPADLTGYSPPFLTALPELGMVQIWSGLIARTAPGWHMLVRGPVNFPTGGSYAVYEGIVETDRWFGPLFSNIRLIRTNMPLRLRMDMPLLQVQPIQSKTYSDAVLSSADIIEDMCLLTDDDWNDYRTTIVTPQRDPARPFGRYATAARKNRRTACPMHDMRL